MIRKARIATVVLAGMLAAGPAHAAGKPAVAALQVALHARGTYRGTIDGVRGPSTAAALIAFQRRAGLAADGVLGPRTRRALGKHGRPAYASRTISYGMVGWDVAALQFLLAWHGFPSQTFDGRFGEHVDAAVRRFQTWAGLPADGIAGRATFRALRRPIPHSPVRFGWPLDQTFAVGDRFGPRKTSFHPGIDIPAPTGTGVLAARSGVVVWAGWAGSYGRLVTIDHGHGVVSMYAHLSRVLVSAGLHVPRGTKIGRVGSTGESSGPHLHFEVRVRDAAVDPLPALV
jgi:peptidoglycan hydrolase-like protein with peptidoglycan-binding domain